MFFIPKDNRCKVNILVTMYHFWLEVSWGKVPVVVIAVPISSHPITCITLHSLKVYPVFHILISYVLLTIYTKCLKSNTECVNRCTYLFMCVLGVCVCRCANVFLWCLYY